jgi:hypothetical protein
MKIKCSNFSRGVLCLCPTFITLPDIFNLGLGENVGTFLSNLLKVALAID